MSEMACRLIRLAATVLLAGAGLSSLQAGSICVAGANGANGRDCNANWQTFLPPIHHDQAPGPSGPAYFDGFSWKGPDSNIADFIAGEGAYRDSAASPHAELPFWGNPDGSAVTSFNFLSEGQSQVATLIAAPGGWAAYNSLGWYDPNSAAWGWIAQANGVTPVLGSVEFNPTAEFGLFFVPDSLTFDPARAYYTDSTRNGISEADALYAAQNGITLAAETAQHFAVFNNPNGGSYIGINDRSNQIGDLDYTDMIIELNQVPEPGTFTLVAGLLLVLGSARRRLFRARQVNS